MKKFAMLLLSLVMTLGLVACNRNDADDGVEPTEPVYTSDEKFEIGMWVGVSDIFVEYDKETGKEIDGTRRQMTDEEFLQHYQEIADAGINIAFPGYSYMNNGGAYNYKALEAAHKVGIKQVIADDGVRQKLINAKNVVDSNAKTEDQVVEEVRALIRPYLDKDYSDALYGFMIKDEPDATFFDSLGYGAEILKKAAPNLMFYVNLFPVIASPIQLGGTADIQYDTYLAQYFNKIKTDYVSYDHYPLLWNGGKDPSIAKDFLYNMDVMKTKILDEGNGRRFWTFLQSISYGLKNRPLQSKADAGFQAYSFLAYGGDGIQWFCYACPPVNDGATTFGNDALVDRDYHKTDTYNYVSAINHDIQALMPYYKNFEWKGVMLDTEAYDGTGNFEYLENSDNVLTENKTLKGLKSESDEAVFAGVFEDKDGRQAFMVVNFTEPSRNCENTVTLTLSGATRAIVVKNGQKTIEKVVGGKLTFTMQAGEGYFVIPY